MKNNTKQILSLVFCGLAFGMHGTRAPAETVKSHFIKNDAPPAGDMTITPMIGTMRLSGLELGVKASFQPFPHGFIPPINDSVSFEGGLLQGMGNDITRTLFSFSMRWDFHLIPSWTVYAAPGLGYENIHFRGDKSYRADDSDIGPALSIGGFFNFAPTQALRLEFDVHEVTQRIGYTFRF